MTKMAGQERDPFKEIIISLKRGFAGTPNVSLSILLDDEKVLSRAFMLDNDEKHAEALIDAYFDQTKAELKRFIREGALKKLK
jgi:hypothetical protein